MSIRTDTEDSEEPKAKLKLRAQVLHGKQCLRWKQFICVDLRLYIPSHPAIAVHSSQQPFYFVHFFTTEHQLLTKQAYIM